MTERESAPARRRLLLGGAATAGAVLLTPALPAEAANGQPLLLGRGNSATAATNLTSNVAGSAASITNTATDKGVALTLKTVAPNGHGAVLLDSAPEGTGAALFANGIDNRAIRAYNRATHERPVIEATAQRNSAEPADTGVAIRALNGPGRASDLDGLLDQTRAAIEAAGHVGVVGLGKSAEGVYGQSVGPGSAGVRGEAFGDAAYGVVATGNNGLRAFGGRVGAEVGSGWVGLHVRRPESASGCAVVIETDLQDQPAIYATGPITSLGQVSHVGAGFVIEHPLDTQNLTLSHSVVESDARRNIYDGIATAGSDGRAVVELPEWFGSLNTDIRYQLTPLDGPAPNLHVYRRVQQGSFVIGGAEPGQEISWQLTGVRRDGWARLNPLDVVRPRNDPPWLEQLRQAREPQE
jgi:hypothetical protein